MFHWDAPLGVVEPNLATDLVDHIPASVAVRVINNAPALAELKGVYDTIQLMSAQETEDGKDGVDGVDSEPAAPDADDVIAQEDEEGDGRSPDGGDKAL